MFAVIFYTSPKEPEKRFRRRSTFLDLTNVPVMFTPLSEDDQNPRKNSISHLFVNSIMASSSFEQIEREGGNENPSRSSYERKRSMVQRFLHAVFDEDESNADKNQLENDVAKTSEISPDLDINACIAARVKNLDRGRKKSLVVRVFDGILARMENDQPKECEDQPVSDNVDADVNGKVTLKDSESEWKFEDGEKLDFDINKDYEDEEQGDYQKDQTKGIVESSVLTAPKSRRHGVTLMPHMKQLSMSHLAHEDDDKCKKADGCVSDTSRHPRALKKSVAFMLPESPVLNEKQLELNPIESDKTQTTTAFERSQDHPETHGTENKGFEPCEEVDEEENGGTTDLPVPCKTPRERKRSKTLKDWLKDPNLYKVAAIFTFCRLAQGSVYAFMALYLIEKLEFPKEASAYFPLVLLTGATSSSFICGKLIRKIGSKKYGRKVTVRVMSDLLSQWSFVLAGSVVMAGAVWSYFQTPATRQLTYVPVAMIGSGLSVMYVMALAFIAELLGEDKESSGSVISIINMIAAVSTSLLAFALQRLYPDNETSSQEEIGDYVRDAFAMASGIPTLMGVLVVLLFQPSRFTCKSKALRDVEAQDDDRVSQCSSEGTSKPKH
ncbi:Major facilitator superfamily domain-containing protein 12 [Stylophora pistillata]|uniref:Major facilitator superfamily domain-containing protein 12 n=1 Tax=Stylophora pistillata TaxID=50429 RepID=A0A2B4RL75_STYPI|nr:Major facilitator superfamily domain-containing protein 12 [Stylophora pistillata]